MERIKSFNAAESIVDSQREIKLAVTSLMRVHGNALIPRESLGDDTEMVAVCPRLVCPPEYLVPKKAAHFVIRDDITVDVERERTALSAEHIAVLNELLALQEPATVRHFAALFCTPQEDPLTLPAQHARLLRARRILDELVYILGEDVVWKDHVGKRYVYQVSDDVGVYDMRTGQPGKMSSLPSATLLQAAPTEDAILEAAYVQEATVLAPPDVPEPPAGPSENTITEEPALGEEEELQEDEEMALAEPEDDPLLYPEHEGETPPETEPDEIQPENELEENEAENAEPYVTTEDAEAESAPNEQGRVVVAELYRREEPTAPKRVVNLFGTELTDTELSSKRVQVRHIPGDATHSLSEAWQQREAFRRAQDGAWHDADDISAATNVPPDIVAKFINHCLGTKRLGGLYPLPQPMRKIVDGQTTGRVTKHFSPGFCEYALANLPRFHAAYLEWQAQQATPES